jgi:hypothetical protein
MSKVDTPEDKRIKDKKLVTVGMVLLLLSWIYISLVAMATFIIQPRVSSVSSRNQKQAKWLLYAILLAIPFLGIRIVTSLVYFTTQNQALNPVTGDLGYRVGLGFIEELVISIAFLVVGVTSRNIGKAVPTANTELREAGWSK